jgi:hypothetical protein
MEGGCGCASPPRSTWSESKEMTERIASNGHVRQKLTNKTLPSGKGMKMVGLSSVSDAEDVSSFLDALLPFLHQLDIESIHQWFLSHQRAFSDEDCYLEELLDFLYHLDDSRVEDWLIIHHPTSANILSDALSSVDDESEEEGVLESMALLGSIPDL